MMAQGGGISAGGDVTCSLLGKRRSVDVQMTVQPSLIEIKEMVVHHLHLHSLLLSQQKMCCSSSISMTAFSSIASTVYCTCASLMYPPWTDWRSSRMTAKGGCIMYF
mmetsp:Transcript_42255/g.62607  ORF Transcript_42255/g.62607 Transcript_42255/m.62607 type:complete len:107 (-) Transcript_42255:122-442(-)